VNRRWLLTTVKLGLFDILADLARFIGRGPSHRGSIGKLRGCRLIRRKGVASANGIEKELSGVGIGRAAPTGGFEEADGRGAVAEEGLRAAALK
jgi:hypothetical protein